MSSTIAHPRVAISVFGRVLKRLLHTGGFRESPTKLARGEGGEFVDRAALFVYDGVFNSMDGEVTITPDMLRALANAHNARLVKLNAADGAWKPEAFPPMQVDHNTSALVTVGRAFGPVKVEEIEIEGEPHTALTGVVRVLGKENVERAEDGRWTSLSIGADFEGLVFKEITVTPFPAAPNARMLSEGAKMDPKKLKAYLKRLHKLSDEDTEKKFSALSEDEKKELSAKLADEQAQFKAHLTGAGLSEKEADEKLSKMSDEDTEKMSAILAAKLASDDEQKKLAEEHDKLKKQLAEKDADGDYDGDKKLKARLAATKGKVLELFAGAEKLSGETRLAALKTSITVRLARLQSEGKITPAERKKIDIAQLAAKGAGVVEERLQSYADREPVIHMGQLGSVTALSVGTLTKKEAKQLAAARIEEESRKNLGMKPDGENVKLLSAIPKGVKLEEGAPKTEAPTHMKHLEQHLANIEKCASEGNVKDLVAHCDALRKALTEMAFPTPGGEGAEKQMSELSAQVEKLVTELAGMKAKVTELIA